MLRKKSSSRLYIAADIFQASIKLHVFATTRSDNFRFEIFDGISYTIMVGIAGLPSHFLREQVSVERLAALLRAWSFSNPSSAAMEAIADEEDLPRRDRAKLSNMGLKLFLRLK